MNVDVARKVGGRRLRGISPRVAPGDPLITIVQPTRNAEATLARAVASVRAQAYASIEYIIVDGASSDRTLEILAECDGEVDYWLSESDGGVYDAMRKGIDLARGEWIYFLGADDELTDCFHLVAPQLRRKDRVYYGDVYWLKAQRTYDGPFSWHKMANKNISQQSIFYPRCLFDSYQFDPRYRICADYDLNLRVWGDGRFKFEYVPFVICRFNDSGLSHTQVDETFESARPELIARAFGKRLSFRRAVGAVRGAVAGLVRRSAGRVRGNSRP